MVAPWSKYLLAVYCFDRHQNERIWRKFQHVTQFGRFCWGRYRHYITYLSQKPP